MSRFHIGQRVRVMVGEVCFGREATITEEVYTGRWDLTKTKIDVPRGVLMYRIDVDSVGSRGLNGLLMCALPHELIPLDDGYDGRELASWDTCPWRPERESAQKGAM